MADSATAAYKESERLIEAAFRNGSEILNLYNLEAGRLTELPHSLGQLTHLRELDISNHNLTTLPDWLTQLTRLQSLRVGGNQTEDRPGLVRETH